MIASWTSAIAATTPGTKTFAIHSQTGSRTDFVAENPTDRADRRNIVLIAYAVGQQLVSDFPCENSRIAVLVYLDVLDHVGRGDSRFGSTDGAWKDGARLVVACQDLGDATVRHTELSADVARPDSQLGKLHDSQSDGVG